MPSPEVKRRRARDRRMRDKQKRIDRLDAADVTGWDKLSPHHFRRIVDGQQIDWWPSTGKWYLQGLMFNKGLEDFLKGKI